jgi:hypothetical protein
MMWRSCALRIAACLVVLAAPWAPAGQASVPPLPQDTARILDGIEKSRGERTPADLQAARRLNAQGDRAYRKQDYRAAFRAYANAYPNHPDAHAYILAGDARWRQVVQHHQAQPRMPPQEPPACRLDNQHFARDLSMDLAQHHQVGLALAERDQDRRFAQSALYRRARESATCLQALAQRYKAEPPSACVDVGELSRCLGAPLLK